MAIQWTFPQLDAAPAEGDLIDVCKTIHWRAVLQHETETTEEGAPLSVTAYGTASAGEADPDNFVAFDDLTQDWCKEIVLAHLDKTEAELEAMLSEQLQNMITPPIVGKVPANWS